METQREYCGAMTSEASHTDMIHLECHVCGITATCVATPSADLAWLDHMDTHSAKTAFSAWTWQVAPLPGL